MEKQTTQEKLAAVRAEKTKEKIAKSITERNEFVSKLPNFEDIEITFSCVEGKDFLSFDKRRFILKSGETIDILKNLTQFQCEDNMDFDSKILATKLAKKHAALTYSHGRLSIMDYGSRRGTYRTSINQSEDGLYPPYKNFELLNNDRIQFGKMTAVDDELLHPVVGKIQFYPASSNSISENSSEHKIILKPSTTSEIDFEHRTICLTDGGEINIHRTLEHQPENSSNLTFNCGALSMSHGRISYHKGNFYIDDLKSRNGTYLNDTRIRNMPKKLEDGDLLRLGVDVIENGKKYPCMSANISINQIKKNETEQLPSSFGDEKRISKTIVFKPLEKAQVKFAARKITLYDGDEIVVQRYDSKSPFSLSMNESNLIFDCDKVSNRHATISLKDDCFYIKVSILEVVALWEEIPTLIRF
jgi:pSer/pThr/pTyr-binding forkhead associated (FHA) protein